jgi:hypothetical protein
MLKARLQKPKIRKLKLLRSNPFRLSSIIVFGLDPYNLPNDDYLIVNSLNRPSRIHENDFDNVELDDYVKFRLFLARELALRKYKEKWG